MYAEMDCHVCECVSVCVCVCVCVCVYMYDVYERSEDNLQESVLHPVGLRIERRSSTLGASTFAL